MKPTPDDSLEIEPPMTRALFATEIEEAARGLSGVDEKTLDIGADTSPRPGWIESTEPKPAGSGLSQGSDSAWSSVGSRRGCVGKIEPDQTLYSKYRVLRKLGGGAMGDVWLVRHATLKSEHALKVIVPNFATNAVALMRFQREFEVMATLRHEHAVTIYDACIDADGGYIDMEFVAGKTLHDVLSDARGRPDRDPSQPLLPLDTIVRLLDQLCDVLQAAHEKGIVHRDLKPANMMLLDGRKPGKEYLKVLDFGIAKIRDDPEGAAGRDQEESAHKTQGFIGTPSYGSPEQAMTREDVDGRADLYSVGIMLYEFVAGRLPFRGSPLQVMSQNATAPPPAFAEANPSLRPMPEVERAILRILSKDREQRPQTARELFEEFLAAAEAVLPPGTLAQVPPTWESFPSQSSYSPPSTMHPTDREAQYPGGLPSTQEATLVGAPSPPRIVKVAREGPSDFGPVVDGPSERSRPKVGLIVGLAMASIMVGMVVVYSLRKGGEAGKKAEPGPVADTSKPVERKTVEKRPSFESHWPSEFVPVKGYGEDKLWPEKVRRTTDQATFVRFADGIYLPESYSPEDPADLVDGWPRVIVRDGVRFLRITGGNEWSMGDWTEPNAVDKPDAPAHPVILSGYYLQETEVTNGQFDDYLRATDRARPSEWEEGLNALKRKKLPEAEVRQHPAVSISREKARAFAEYMEALLPTEAQWEFAARSRGLNRRFVTGNSPEPSRDRFNVDSNTIQTSPVRSYPDDKTVEGVHDMTGSVQEMTRDAWEPYRKSTLAVLDPCQAPADPSKAEFAIRGGSYSSLPGECTTTRRADHRPDKEPVENLGFRLVVECPDTRKPR